MPERIQLSRAKGWRMPEDAVSVARPGRWGNPLRYRTPSGLARMPAVVGDGPWEYEGRVSADGARHDYHHADGRITVCTVRYMTLAELVETYERALTGNPTPSMRSAGRLLSVTAEDARRELAGKSLACWCPVRPLVRPHLCHRDVLFTIANPALAAAA